MSKRTGLVLLVAVTVVASIILFVSSAVFFRYGWSRMSEMAAVGAGATSPNPDVIQLVPVWQSNAILAATLGVACIAGFMAWLQVRESAKQQETAIVLEVYRYIYDRQFREAKKIVYRNTLDLIHANGLEDLSDDVKDSVDFLLTTYNNIGKLLLRKLIKPDALPLMFFRNAQKNHSRVTHYIQLRRDSGKQNEYARHYEEMLNAFPEYCREPEEGSE